LLIFAGLGLPQMQEPSAMAAGVTQYLPRCDADPALNTIRLQDAIDHAPDGTTLVLPPGVCVVAKCDVIYGNGNPSKSCYGAAGDPHYSALHIGKWAVAISNLTIAGDPSGTSVLKLDPKPPRTSTGYHAYCGLTHVLSIEGSKYISLQHFTVDGS